MNTLYARSVKAHSGRLNCLHESRQWCVDNLQHFSALLATSVSGSPQVALRAGTVVKY